MISSTLTKGLVTSEEKEPQSIILPPPCFTVVVCVLGAVFVRNIPFGRGGHTPANVAEICIM